MGGQQLHVAEVGVDIGATTCEALKFLDKNDTYYIFDFDFIIEELLNDLKGLEYAKSNIVGCGNTKKLYDSYAWSLQKLYKEMKRKPVFNLVYLDGAHTFFHDGLAICILKKMIAHGGILLLDDMDWTIKESPTCNPGVNPKILDQYTDEQMETEQVAIAVELFLEEAPEWEEITEHMENSPRRKAYRRL